MPNTADYFDQLFTNTRQNAMFIMSTAGIITKVNEAFTTAYGYATEDIADKHFRVLYIEKDQVTRRPEIELNVTLREGSSSDENYLVHQDGSWIWVTGESVLIRSAEGEVIVKVIHNIHAQKQLERYLLASHELLDTLFESVKQSGLLILDAQMRIVKANKTFGRLFSIQEPLVEGSRLQDIPHPFWSEEEVKADIRNVLVQRAALNKMFLVDKEKDQRLQISSKLIFNENNAEKRLLLVVKEA